MLRSLSRLLSFDFDIVGAVTDGHQGLEASLRLNPDIVVMDITMPGRDGFQTARDLRERGVRAPIVFLTMHESEEFVAEAFRAGASGYVLKTRLHMDLVSAVERVLAGQLFLPSLNSLFAIDESPTGHVVQFHVDERALVESVSGFLNQALRRGDVVWVAFTAPIRAGLAQRLRGYGWNVGELGSHGSYRATDAVESLSSILRNGRPDAAHMADMVADIERARVSGPRGSGSRLTLVGDIAAHLILKGNLDAAMELEHQWSDLTRSLPFLSVCCYPTPSFAEDTNGHLIPQLCAEHHAVTHSPEVGTRSSLH